MTPAPTPRPGNIPPFILKFQRFWSMRATCFCPGRTIGRLPEAVKYFCMWKIVAKNKTADILETTMIHEKKSFTYVGEKYLYANLRCLPGLNPNCQLLMAFSIILTWSKDFCRWCTTLLWSRTKTMNVFLQRNKHFSTFWFGGDQLDDVGTALTHFYIVSVQLVRLALEQIHMHAAQPS